MTPIETSTPRPVSTMQSPSADLARDGVSETRKRITTGEIQAFIHNDPMRERLEQCFALARLLGGAVFSSAYRTRAEWTQCVVPSEAGLAIIEKQLVTFSKEDVMLALFLQFAYQDLLIDHHRTDIAAVKNLVNLDFSTFAVRFPYRFGRGLYDKFNDSFLENISSLSASESEALLNNTPQGIFQIGTTLIGPLGLLTSQEARYLPPSNDFPLWHCSDTGCRALHEVTLQPWDIPINSARDSLRKVLEKEFTDPAQWVTVLSALDRNGKWPFGRRYYDIAVLIGDCIVGRERASLVTKALAGHERAFLRQTLGDTSRGKTIATGSPAQVVERLTGEEQHHLLLTLSDLSLIQLLDQAIDNGELIVPANEVRSARFAPPQISFADSASELSSLGIRSCNCNPFELLATLVLHAYRIENKMNELEWHLRQFNATNIGASIVEFINGRGPMDTVRQMILSSKAITQRMLSILSIPDDGRFVNSESAAEKLLWKLGFDFPRHDEFESRFRNRLEAFRETVLGVGDSFAEDERESIRSSGVNLFVSVEQFLGRLLAYNVWVLASDHFGASEFTYNPDDANELVGKVLGASLRIDDAPISWNGKGENALGAQLRYLEEAATWMQRLEDECRDAFRRSADDIPHFAEYKIRPFPFMHTQLWADAEIGELRTYAIGFCSIVKLLSQSKLVQVRNGIDHYRNENKFPSPDEILACATRLQQAFDLSDQNRYLPKTFWLHRMITDINKATALELQDYRGKMLNISRPALVWALPTVSFDIPVIVAMPEIFWVPEIARSLLAFGTPPNIRDIGSTIREGVFLSEGQRDWALRTFLSANLGFQHCLCVENRGQSGHFLAITPAGTGKGPRCPERAGNRFCILPYSSVRYLVEWLDARGHARGRFCVGPCGALSGARTMSVRSLATLSVEISSDTSSTRKVRRYILFPTSPRLPRSSTTVASTSSVPNRMRTRPPTRKGTGFFQIQGSTIRGFTIVVLRVQVAAETLELRRKQQSVSLVELLRRRAFSRRFLRCSVSRLEACQRAWEVEPSPTTLAFQGAPPPGNSRWFAMNSSKSRWFSLAINT